VITYLLFPVAATMIETPRHGCLHGPKPMYHSMFSTLQLLVGLTAHGSRATNYDIAAEILV